MSPERIQLRRVKGYRKPEGAVVVARPSPWGNPFPWQGDWIVWTAIALGYRADAAGRRAAAVALYRAWMTGEPIQLGPKAADSAGGALEFANGRTVSMGDHVRGIAAFAASRSPLGEIPPRPSVEELRGKDLACWCGPGPCHADVLLEIANE